jgi:Epoxide hydrolase N terminus
VTYAPTPFRIAIPDSQLDDLRDRLARTRWPDPETVGDWSQGVERIARAWAALMAGLGYER